MRGCMGVCVCVCARGCGGCVEHWCVCVCVRVCVCVCVFVCACVFLNVYVCSHWCELCMSVFCVCVCLSLSLSLSVGLSLSVRVSLHPGVGPLLVAARCRDSLAAPTQGHCQ